MNKCNWIVAVLASSPDESLMLHRWCLERDVYWESMPALFIKNALPGARHSLQLKYLFVMTAEDAAVFKLTFTNATIKKA